MLLLYSVRWIASVGGDVGDDLKPVLSFRNLKLGLFSFNTEIGACFHHQCIIVEVVVLLLRERQSLSCVSCVQSCGLYGVRQNRKLLYYV